MQCSIFWRLRTCFIDANPKKKNPAISTTTSNSLLHNKHFLLHFPHITILRLLLDDYPMAGFTDTLRGDWLARAQRALATLERDSLRLDRERQRFSHSPPSYASNLSGTTTRSASPKPPPPPLPQWGASTPPGATNAAGREARGLRTTQTIRCSG